MPDREITAGFFIGAESAILAHPLGQGIAESRDKNERKSQDTG
jgi:hypothetical protein